MGKRELVALLSLFSWCLIIVVWLFLSVPWVCLQFLIVVFPDLTHLLFCKPPIMFMYVVHTEHGSAVKGNSVTFCTPLFTL